MILLTEAPNDASLLPMFGGLATLAPIPHGDFAFFGTWEEGKGIRVCIERKRTRDLLTCIQSTGRHLKQVQDAHDDGFEFIALIWEEDPPVRRSMDGLLEIRWGQGWTSLDPQMEYSRLSSYLYQISLYLGVLVLRSHNSRETVQHVIDLYHLFQKEPEKHSSLHGFYSPPIPQKLLVKPSLVRRVAKELPGIGWQKSETVAQHFHSVRAMVNATEAEWRGLDGIGVKGAKAIAEVLE